MWPTLNYMGNYYYPEIQYNTIRTKLTTRINRLDELINALTVTYDNKDGDNEDFGAQQDSTGYFNFGF